MKVINFIGDVDKRILTLPTARGLTFLGETLVVTDDSNYKRLADKDNIISGIKILYAENIENSLIEDYDDGVVYQNIVVDSTSFIYEKADKKIICRHKDRSLIPKNILDSIDELDIEGELIVETDEVVLTAFVPKKKGFGKKVSTVDFLDRHEESKLKAKLITLKALHYQWLYMCEETRDICPLQDAEVINYLDSKLHDTFNMQDKGFSALLMRTN